MGNIRPAEEKDISRIAEILIFTKRVNYRGIFNNDEVSFGEMQVLPLARKFIENPALLKKYFVYDDGLVKGITRIEGDEIVELYVDSFFVGKGIGGELIEFAKTEKGAKKLWVLEKNLRAIEFYKSHGFFPSGKRKPEDGTEEYIIEMQREKQ